MIIKNFHIECEQNIQKSSINVVEYFFQIDYQNMDDFVKAKIKKFFVDSLLFSETLLPSSFIMYNALIY